VLSLGGKAVFVVLTFAGAGTLWAAIAADMGVTLAVIANALMIGGLVTSTVFSLLVLPTFYLQVHSWLDRRASRAEA
jgi:Cu/Ag efflux pump CusA